MVGLFGGFASSGPVVYITSKDIFTIHGIEITNSIFYGWICGVILLVILITLARRMTLKPKGGLTQYVEIGVSYISTLVESSFEDPKRGTKYVPYFVTLFFFLLFNNWLGLVPGVGEAIKIHGNPLLRPFTGDLNATLAVGIVTMGLVYFASIKEAGAKDYLKHFFIGNPLNPMYLFLGIIEMFTDMTRVISLSIRLFLNVTIGEIVIAVFAYLGSFLAPVTAAPFTIIELFVGALQAYIFVILSVMYLAIAVNHATAEHSLDLTDELVTERIGLETENA
ncbi:MAG TPA: F0F1 ATP synthase subunit A [Candidatus Saccharimonadales bacterium]|jgi:F-type H+-transporting ATPase subunit a|nr:F0F1 ATP synthase subunit A [Candidatus Saccharimonadales bacterium]